MGKINSLLIKYLIVIGALVCVTVVKAEEPAQVVVPAPESSLIERQTPADILAMEIELDQLLTDHCPVRADSGTEEKCVDKVGCECL